MQGELVGAYQQKGVVQDSVHGFIPINEAEYWLLQTAFMRRLHNIKQLGMAFLVFPSAHHSRLEHSLGVMHIASRMAQRIAGSLSHNDRLCSEVLYECNYKHLNNFVQIVRLSGLLHDIGHLAYSHMSEEAIEYMAKYGEDQHSRKLFEELSRLSGGALKVHEAYGVSFISKLESLSSSFEGPQLDVYLEAVAELLKPGGPTVREPLEDLGIRPEAYGIIHDIISNEIADADRLDYLQRDAQATGIVYGNIDLDRLVEGIGVSLLDDGRPFLSLDIKSLQTLEDVFDARYKMYRSVYYHHKVIAISKSVSRFIRELPQSHAQLLEAYGDDLREAIRPSSLANAIAEDLYYFDDSELDVIIRSAARGEEKLIKRWALSLLERRDLLPLSLIKRSEEVMVLATEILRKHDLEPSPSNLSRLLSYVSNKVSAIQDDLRKATGNPNIMVDCFSNTIINLEKLRRGSNMFNWSESSYLRAIVDQSSIPVLLLYAYSDYMNDHLNLIRAKAKDVREAAKKILQDVLNEGVRDIKS